jgi:hypothetical protein
MPCQRCFLRAIAVQTNRTVLRQYNATYPKRVAVTEPEDSRVGRSTIPLGPEIFGVPRFSSRRFEFWQSQVAFAESSVCDRIAFARWSRRNGTAIVPSGEKGTKACREIRWDAFSGPV